ncbi:MAG: lipopolysaccharide biosynthesis protein [Sphingomonadales bacterium]|nr:lipopolysaccharide biosynthesis protein [Sphingomonadales bacterium]
MSNRPVSSPEIEQSPSNLIGALPLVLWQRRWLVLIPAVLIALAAVAAAFLLPRSYRARAVLLVESQNLPDSTASSSLNDVIDRRIAKIREQILARPDLVGLIQANNLYDVDKRAEPLSVLVDRMRDATDISAVDADISKAPGANAAKGSIAFQLTFDYRRPAEAQLVAQTFVDRLLRLDASETQNEAETNVHFLEDQESALQTQIAGVEAQINQIAGANGAALAATGGASMISIGSGDYESQIAALRSQNVQLQSQLGGVGLGRDPGVIAAEAQLAAAKAQYSDSHPDVKLAEARLAAAKTNAKTVLDTGSAGPIEHEIAANNDAIAQLTAARNAAVGHAVALASAQARGPVVAQRVAQLSAKADQLRAELAKVSSNLLDARSIVKLADEQRGERLTLIDPPVTPDRPNAPNRPLLIVGGILGGLAFGIGLALLVEMIHRPIRSVSALTRLVGVPPLAVVPVLSKRVPRRRRKGVKRLTFASGGGNGA